MPDRPSPAPVPAAQPNEPGQDDVVELDSHHRVPWRYVSEAERAVWRERHGVPAATAVCSYCDGEGNTPHPVDGIGTYPCPMCDGQGATTPDGALLPRASAQPADGWPSPDDLPELYREPHSHSAVLFVAGYAAAQERAAQPADETAALADRLEADAENWNPTSYGRRACLVDVNDARKAAAALRAAARSNDVVVSVPQPNGGTTRYRVRRASGSGPPVPYRAKGSDDSCPAAPPPLVAPEPDERSLLRKLMTQGAVEVRTVGPLTPPERQGEWFLGLDHSTVDLTPEEAELLKGLLDG